jgi:phage terminase large subunit
MNVRLPHLYSPRFYQNALWKHFIPKADNKYAVVLAHRRWGKDKLCINISAVQSQLVPGLYWHILPYAKQARAAVWNAIDKNNGSMKLLDHFPKELISHTNENEMRIHFKNGSIWQLMGGDDFDKLVGTNPVGVVLSEWALMEKRVYDYLRPILMENNGWCIKITTVRGMNHAWQDAQLCKELMKDDPNALYVNQTIEDTKALPPGTIDRERAKGMSDFMIKQEYYNDPTIPLQGSYYAAELFRAEQENRITNVPWEPKVPVDTYWDIGHTDLTVIVFVQEVGMEKRVIDCYFASGEAVPHYKKILDQRPYNYGRHHGPWDLEIGQLAAGGKSVYDAARAVGIKFVVTPQPRSVADGIEQVRNIFPGLWFDKTKCERLLKALKGYRKEPLKEELQEAGRNRDDDSMTVYKENPLHSWESHFADAVRIMAWHFKKRRLNLEPLQEKAVDDYKYL